MTLSLRETECLLNWGSTARSRLLYRWNSLSANPSDAKVDVKDVKVHLCGYSPNVKSQCCTVAGDVAKKKHKTQSVKTGSTR